MSHVQARSLAERLASLTPEQRRLLEAELAAQGGSGKPLEIPRQASGEGPFPLSFAQQRLWFLEQLEPGVNHVSTFRRIRSRIVPRHAIAAYDEVVRRHDALRTTFGDQNGAPGQRVHPPSPRQVPLVDLELLSKDDRGPEIRRLQLSQFRRPFDLGRLPLLRLALVRLADDDFGLLLTMHHIISDDWSIDVFFRELQGLYEAYATGRTAKLPELPIQYPDFALWQREHLTGEVLADHLDYWRGQLAGSPPGLDLPMDRPRPPMLTHHGARHGILLTSSLSDAWRALSKARGTTLYVTFLAAFFTLLHRISGESDIVLGSPIANRNRREIEGLIGFFVNTLVLRADLADNPLWTDLVASLGRQLLGAQSHQDLPFEKLVEELKPERSLQRSPLFQVVFVTQKGFVADRRTMQPGASAAGSGAARRERTLFTHVSGFPAQFDLTLRVDEGSRRLALSLEYNVDLFDTTRMARFGLQLVRLLEALVQEPEQRVSGLSILSAAERHQLVTEWSGDIMAGAVRPLSASSLPEVFMARAAASPEAVAVVTEQGLLSYGELDRRSAALARHLRRLGATSESRIGLLVERSPEMLVAILGVLAAGAAYVPLDPAAPADRLAYLLADALDPEGDGPSIVIVAGELEATLPADLVSGLTLVDISDAIDLSHGGEGDPTGDLEATPVVIHPDQAAYVIYTSGSTGRPKGVVITHRNVLRLFTATDPWYDFGPEDVWTLFHSYAFDFSVWEIWGALLYGGRLVVVPYWVSREPAAMFGLLLREKVTVLNQTPSAFKPLILAAEEMREGELALEWVIFGGEALAVSSLAPWWRRVGASGPRMINMYGITETTVHVTYREISAGETTDGVGSAVGLPIPDLTTHVLGRRGEPMAIGAPGELAVGGEGLARGYLGRPSLTAQRFVPDAFGAGPGGRLYRSGDLGRWLPGGELEHLGRIDHQVKIRGFRIELGEIEEEIRAYPGVRAVAVQARPDGPVGETWLVGYVVETEEGSASPDALREHLRQSLPDYMVPSAFVTLPELPLTINGKLDSRALPAPARSASARGPVQLPPDGSLQAQIAEIWREILGLDEVGVRDNFFDLGGHSLLMVQVQRRLVRELEREIPILELFRHPTIAALGLYLEPGQSDAPVVAAGPLPEEGEGTHQISTEGIAVIGMVGRFPGSPDVDTLWRNLLAGIEGVSFFSREELLAAGVSEASLDHPAFVNAHGALERIEEFDADFFGMTPREAQITDPQHRIFLECAWHALESASIDPQRFPGPIGLFAGVGFNTYWFHLMDNPEITGAMGSYKILLGNDKDYLPTKVSYKLDLKGPSVSVQTACSTSLVATHLACQSLRTGESDLALAGGVTISSSQVGGYHYEEGAIASPDGHCRAFDAQARGTVGGSGVAIVVLRRLSDAIAAGDPIRAVIRGSAINNDGSLKVGYTAPSIEGQAVVIRRALTASRVDPATVGYIEAHGTGTVLGDPIEIAALSQAYGSATDERGYCAIGSIKTNVGHLDAAAGATGLIKAVLAVEHGQVPPSLHYTAPNPEIDFASSPFYVNAELSPWPLAEGPRRAAVSSFGIGGTNAHAILEQGPEAPPSGPSRPWQLLVVSAKTERSLRSSADNLARHLEAQSAVDPSAAQPLADVAYTLQLGRAALEHRRFVVCQDTAEAIAALDRGHPAPNTSDRAGSLPSVAFLFPGQGAQYPGMGGHLYRGLETEEVADAYAGEPVFRDEVDRCCEILQPLLGRDLRTLLFPAEGEAEAAGKLQQTALAQPALFVIEVALARLWESWGVRARAVLGHSIGEFAAAHLAGVMSREDALKLVVVRGRLMQGLPPGSMLALPMGEEEALRHLGQELALAAINGPERVVVSGPTPAIEALAERLAGEGIEARRLHTSHAFHSAMMEPILDPFAAAVREARLAPPRRPWVSTVTGTWITADEATDPAYWVRQVRSPVRLAAGLATLLAEPGGVLLEVGPGRTLSSLARQHPDWGRGKAALASIRHPQDAEPDLAFLLKTLGRLWAAGVEIDWAAFAGDEERRRVPLPLYPFDRQRFWLERDRGGQRRQQARPEGKREDISEWFYTPSWEITAPPPPADLAAMVASGAIDPEEVWLLFADAWGLAEALAARLAQAGIEVVLVRPASAFEPLGTGVYGLAPRDRTSYEALLDEIQRKGQKLSHIVHLWGVTDEGGGAPGGDGAANGGGGGDPFVYGCGSLILLGQALTRKLFVDPITLTAVTSSSQDVLAGEQPNPEKVAALGPLQVLSQEQPNLTCRAVDVDLPRSGGARRRRVDLLLDELLEGGEAGVAYRGARRYRRVYQPLRLEREERHPSVYRSRGTYLLLGGLGRIGLSLAAELARQTQGRLVLVGRSVPPPKEEWEDWLAMNGPEEPTSRKILRLRELEELGAEVVVTAADVAEIEHMRSVITGIEERFGELHGVFFLAGASAERTFIPLENLDFEDLVLHFRPKIEGAKVLVQVLEEARERSGLQPEICVVFSSLASVLGGLGFAAYSAANIFLDAFVQRHNSRAGAQADSEATPWVAINWDGWLPPGEKVASGGLGASVAELAMTHEEGLQALERILLAGAQGSVVVSTGDLEPRRRKWLRPAMDEEAEPTSLSLHARPELSTDYLEPDTETERRVSELWSELLGIESVGLEDNFYELGGDSLLATQVISRLRHLFRVDLPMSSLFETPTVAGLAAALEAGLSAEAEVEDLEAILARIESMSSDELEARLSGSEGMGGTD